MRKRNIIGLAVAAALSIGAATQSANAANLASNGVGELAYIPYYSTLDGKQSFVRLVNNGFDTLIVKLKIREGRQSIDARDFYIFLSPRDVWTGRVFSEEGGIRLHTNDTSCTVPSKASWRADASGWSINVPDVNGEASTEGYIVAQVAGTSQTSVFSPFDDNTDVASLVKHINNDPRNCGAVSAAFEFVKGGTLQLANPAAFASVRSQFTEPTNALSAAAAIVNPVNSTLTDLPVTVVANVYNPGPTGVDGTSGYTEVNNADKNNDTISSVTDDTPNERDVAPLNATIFDDSSASANTLNFLSTALPVSAALMHSSVMNNLDTTGANSWVVTFPTKRSHLSTPCSAPFPADCVPDITSPQFSLQHIVRDSGAISYVTNEEESEFVSPTENEICFSGPDVFDVENCPVGPVAGQVGLENEVNIITFNEGNPLNSSLTANVPGNVLGDIVFGWMQMRFVDAVPVTDSAATTTLYGLPVIGFAYTEYNINGVTTTMSQAHTFSSPLRP